MTGEDVFNLWADFIAAGFGAISGEELNRRTAERSRHKPRDVLLAEIEQVASENRDKQAAEWEKWLKPAEWCPDAVIIDLPPLPPPRRAT